MKYFLLAVLILIPSAIRADEARFREIFTSENGKFELKLNTENGIWSLIDTTTNKEVYNLEGNISSMTVVISDDGNSVAVIDDYSEQDEKKNPEVLCFYSYGKKIKSYKLYDLISNRKFVSFSVSHFDWLFTDTSSYKPFTIESSQITLQTHELNNYSFRIETGEMLKKERDAILSGDAIYVFGDIFSLGNDFYQIKVRCVLYGETPVNKTVKFESKKYKWIGGNTDKALIIQEGKFVANKGVIFNACDSK